MRNLLVKAVGLHQRGALAEAESLYRQVLRAFPKNADALRLCGIACSQQGKNEEAKGLLERAVAAAPAAADSHNALGKVFNDLGDFEKGEHHCRVATKLNPRFAEAFDNLANAQLALGRAADAEGSYRKAVSLSPKNPLFLSNLGSCLAVLGRNDDAADCYLEALKIKPTFSKALRNLGRISQKVFLLDGIIEAFERSLKSQDRTASLLLDYADILISAGRPKEAVTVLEEVLESHPGAGQALLTLALAKLELDRADEAAALLEEAIGSLEDRGALALRIGTLYSRMGDFDAAEAWFTKAQEKNPTSGLALYNLANIKRLNAQSPLFAEALKIADDESAEDYERANACFAIADVLDREKRYDEAFDYYARANNHFQVPEADWSRKHRNLEAFREVFTPDLFKRLEAGRNSDPSLIFVVGMPRSGTTLTEKILARHPKVAGAGELNEIPSALHRLGMTRNTANYPALLKELTAPQIAQAAEGYLAKIRDLCGPEPERLVDKLPGNSWYVGWIHLLFPEAKVVFCKRNPMDVALSCYRANFSSLTWAFRLESIARQIDLQLRAMTLWQELFPGLIYELEYEALVSNPEREIPALIEGVGLDWDPACLDEEARTKSQVKTASIWQVRQPISTGSVESWRRYAKGLEPLRKLLVEAGQFPADG